MKRNFAIVAALFVVGVAALFIGQATATETSARLFDRSIARVESGTTDIDVSAADYTGYITLLTVTPHDDHAMEDVSIVLDLDTGDDAGSIGWAGANSASETVKFAIARKIQGLWRIDDEVETTAVGEDAADNRCVTLNAGLVGPNEDLRVYVLLSAEGADSTFGYIVQYRSAESATFTGVTKG